jgi:hypothetical protein
LEVIRVVCTGKGSHREKGCGHWFDYGEFTPTTMRMDNDRRIVTTYGQPYSEWREADKPLKSSYTFTCRRCNPMRETRMKAKALRTRLDGLHAKGLTTLDISQLPF